MPVRRSSLVLVAVAALLCSMFAAPAVARVAPGDSGKATADRATSAAQAALSNVRGLFAGEHRSGRALGLPGVAPAPIEPADHAASDATMALRDLALLKHQLSGAERAEAEAFLARPTDRPGGGNPDASYSVEEAAPACSGAVCVHYVPTSADAPAPADGDGNGRPDYVDDVLATTLKVHNTYVGAGYRAPKGDRSLGGSSQTDIYIADIGDDGLYGYCTSDQRIPRRGPFDAWAYCVIDNDYSRAEFPTNTPTENLQVTLAHEYFHAVQFGYDIAEDSWFLEATAAWVEDEMYTGVNDNLQYLRQSPLRLPRVPMDTFGGSFHYGTWIFFRYLSERYPASKAGLPTIVRDMVRKTDGSRGKPDKHSMAAVRAVLKRRGTTFSKTFAKFSNANRRPAKIYDEGRANRYPAAPLAKRYTLGPRQSKTRRIKADHLTSSTVRFRPSKKLRGKNTKLRMLVRMAPARRGSAAVASITLKSGRSRAVALRIKPSGVGVKSLPFSSRSVRHIELTLANAGTRYRCFVGGPYSCQGVSKDDNVRETFRVAVRRR